MSNTGRVLWMERKPPNVTIKTDLGAVQIFYMEARGERLLALDVTETIDGESTVSSIALPVGAVEKLRDVLARWRATPTSRTSSTPSPGSRSRGG